MNWYPVAEKKKETGRPIGRAPERMERERLAKKQAQAVALEERRAKEQAETVAWQERQQKDKLAAYLRSLGINPDAIG